MPKFFLLLILITLAGCGGGGSAGGGANSLPANFGIAGASSTIDTTIVYSNTTSSNAIDASSNGSTSTASTAPGTVGENGSGTGLNPGGPTTVPTNVYIHTIIGVTSAIDASSITVNGTKFTTANSVVTDGFNQTIGLSSILVGSTVSLVYNDSMHNPINNASTISLLPSVRGKISSHTENSITLDIANKIVALSPNTIISDGSNLTSIFDGDFIEVYGYEIPSTTTTHANLILKLSAGPNLAKLMRSLARLAVLILRADWQHSMVLYFHSHRWPQY